MRFLANENVPGPVVRRLRELGHDVVWAKEDLRGETDRALLSLAQADPPKAFRSGLPAACGVVLLRIPWTDPIADNAFAVSTLTSRENWTGVFAVVEHDRIRLRPLPKPTPDHDASGS